MIERHVEARKVEVDKVSSMRIEKHNAVWTFAPNMKMNQSFHHPGDKTQYDSSALWAHQIQCQQPVITRKMLYAGIVSAWDQYIYTKDENVDFRYDEADKKIREFGRNIEFCNCKEKVLVNQKRGTWSKGLKQNFI